MTPTRPRRWPALAAAAWAFTFAAMSVYWAAGGTLGGATIGGPLADAAERREPAMVAVLWITAALKALAGVFALALVRPWGRRLPRRVLRVLAWTGGVGLLLYSLALLVQHGLMEAGAIERARSLDASELRWHLWFWDPFWLLGGILFTMAAYDFGRSEERDAWQSESRSTRRSSSTT